MFGAEECLKMVLGGLERSIELCTAAILCGDD
jgi:hypothetical protein